MIVRRWHSLWVCWGYGSSEPSRRTVVDPVSLAQLRKFKHDFKLGEDSNAPDEVKALVPSDHPYRCVSKCESTLRGEFEPLYSDEGQVRRA
eukprot:6181637-Pleurochrysis_carterae.AAC.1